MCTLTHLKTDTGYHVFFNRDEQQTRPKAQAPQHHTHYIAPIDGLAGGTWIGCTRQGITMALLNNYEYEATHPSGSLKSRGLLVTALLRLNSIESVITELNKTDLHAFNAFHLVLFDSIQTPITVTWNRKTLTRTPALFPILSSSFDSETCKKTRKTTYQTLIEKSSAQNKSEEEKINAHLTFHKSHIPEKGNYSVCVHRETVQTVSLTHVHVSPSRITMGYCNGSPCCTPLQKTVLKRE